MGLYTQGQGLRREMSELALKVTKSLNDVSVRH